jgi:hypothetical protein
MRHVVAAIIMESVYQEYFPGQNRKIVYKDLMFKALCWEIMLEYS